MRFHWLRPRVTKKATRSHSYRPLLERLEDRSVPAVFTVTNTNDGGPGSLWQAIDDANVTPNAGVPDEIHFDIPGSGVHTIHQVSRPPSIKEAVVIDGYTQPGASVNTLAVGDNAVLNIEIDCSSMPNFLFGLFYFEEGSGSTVRGLVINNLNTHAFDIENVSNSNTIAGNFIGTDPTGMVYETGGVNDIVVNGHDNTIGGPDPADRNVINAPVGGPAGMISDGLGAFHTIVQGNYIGVNAAGTAALTPGPANGIFVTAAAVGGDLIANNVIVASDHGIRLDNANNTIQDNFIGTNATGTAGLGTGMGILVQWANAPAAPNNTITGNLISGNAIGIAISSTDTGLVIQGNKIGTDITGTAAVPNSVAGILINGRGGALIGGTNPGEGNLIAFNGGPGVFAFGGVGVDGYALSGNSIFANGGLGIDLSGGNAPDGVTRNDPGDTDPGTNNLQNFPDIASAVTGGGQTVITGTLNSTPNTTFRLEFFANDVANPSGNGEGRRYLGFGTATTDDSGNGSFDSSSFAIPLDASSAGEFISATATDPANNTSEFCADLLVTTAQNATPVITSFTGPASGFVGESLLYQGAFSDPDTDTWTGTINFGDGSGDQPLTLNPDKTFSFAHTFNDPWAYTVTVSIADNHGGVDSRSLTTTITDGHPPVITSFNGPATGLEGDSLVYQFVFSDPDPNDTWTATFNWGDGTGDQYSAIPVAMQSVLKTYLTPGTNTIVLTITDNHGNSDSHSLTTTITGNTAPVARNNTANLNTAASTTINVLANDSDPDGDPLTVTAVTQPPSGHGTVTINADGTLAYTQNVFFNGTESFTYAISDGHGGTATATVTVTVNLSAAVGIDMLRDQVNASSLGHGRKTSLIAKLDAAERALAKSHEGAAIHKLVAFSNEVRAFKRAHILSADLANLWEFEVESILAEIRRGN